MIVHFPKIPDGKGKPKITHLVLVLRKDILSWKRIMLSRAFYIQMVGKVVDRLVNIHWVQDSFLHEWQDLFCCILFLGLPTLFPHFVTFLSDETAAHSSDAQ